MTGSLFYVFDVGKCFWCDHDVVCEPHMAARGRARRKGKFDSEKIFAKTKCGLGNRFSRAAKCVLLEGKAAFRPRRKTVV
ncbi:hypothetical protein M2103_001959 [Ereboglobus sp. PH5-5]|uniref:hypothetical protein n=1 Tax=unclassified Ereboglobus TaxID=2626932 RepID=UPI002406948C|nr:MULTISPECIES: hypothetical protein [unclassified Ereboglobus]MDF9827249.1 hypothetical protein [Ereboglobus sp. PH5-10]MDF9833726.1 hypothetical protein [Ereboglobus sp. PH5-5]